MRSALVTLAIVAAFVLATFALGARGLAPGPSTLRLTARPESTSGTTRVLGLYSANYKGKVGTEVIGCPQVNRSFKVCLAFLRTARGTLTAQGLVPGAATFMSLGVLGGTGIYSNVGGELTIVVDEHGAQRVVGDLVAF